MGNRRAPREPKNAHPKRVWMGDGLGWEWMGESGGRDDVSEVILPGSGLSCTTLGPRSPHLTRIRGRTPEKRRETTRNEGKRREGASIRTTLVGPLDPSSVGTGPLYSASPAYWLQRKMLAQEIRSLIGCLLLLARGRLRLCSAAVPPPQMAPQLGSLLTPPQEGEGTQGESEYRVRKMTALLPGLFFRAIQKQI